MMSLGLRHSRQQQQAIRGVILAQTAGQLFSAIVVPRRQRHVDGPGARILVRRIARHQVVIDHPGLFVHFAALVQPRHGEHQIGILRIALHSADQLVIRRGVIALLAQAVGFVDHIAIANARQLRRRTAGLQLRIADQVLRLAGQPGLIQDGDLIGVIPGIAGYAAADIVAHQRDRGGQVAALGQQTRQLAGVRRGFWRRGGHRPQGIAGGDGIALRQVVFGRHQLQVVVHPLAQIAHVAGLAAAGNARQQRLRLLPGAVFAGKQGGGIQRTVAGAGAIGRRHQRRGLATVTRFLQQPGQIKAQPGIVRIAGDAFAQSGNGAGWVTAADLRLGLTAQGIARHTGHHPRLQFLPQALRERLQHRLRLGGFILLAQHVIEVFPRRRVLRIVI